MENFIGVKMVQAEPMKRHDAAVCGYTSVDASVQPSAMLQDGYHVLYPDGYHSWCPKEVFEKANFRITSTQVGELDAQRLMVALGMKPSEDTLEAEVEMISQVQDNLQFVVDWATNGLQNG